MRIDTLPIWSVFALTMVVVMLTIEVGYRLAQAVRRGPQDEKDSPISGITGSILGLAAFMLAFTFGIVAERHDAKKALVREDAIALRTAWQRADFLPDTDRPEAKALLREYIDDRVQFAQEGNAEPEHVKHFLSEAQRIQDRLWDMAVVNARKDMNSDVAALYVDALNQVNGIHASRVAVAIQARIPGEIWLVLALITVIGMTCVGYQAGIAESKRSMVQALLALSFALVFALIASLDRPDSGVVRVTQQPLVDLRAAIAASPGGASPR